MNWFPPAPSEGPITILDLPADDWAIEQKMNGARVVLTDKGVFTRQGTPLTKGKGVEHVPAILSFSYAGAIEGEWIQSTRTLWVFDLPDLPEPYEVRREHLAKLVKSLGNPRVQLVPSSTNGFRAFYERLKGEPDVEGVVMKRRASMYQKCARPNTKIRDWLKRRFSFDS